MYYGSVERLGNEVATFVVAFSVIERVKLYVPIINLQQMEKKLGYLYLMIFAILIVIKFWRYVLWIRFFLNLVHDLPKWE